MIVKWVKAIEDSVNTIMLNRIEFINVSFGIIGWILIQNGIYTPNLKLAFVTHHSKYRQNIPIIKVAKKFIFNFSRERNIEFKKGCIGKPLLFFMIKKIKTCSHQQTDRIIPINPSNSFPIYTNGFAF